MSASRIRDQTSIRALSLRLARVRISSRSRSPIAGMPISNSGTPKPSKRVAMSIFSSREKATPADCSPSRKVVSSIITVRAFMVTLYVCISDLTDWARSFKSLSCLQGLKQPLCHFTKLAQLPD